MFHGPLHQSPYWPSLAPLYAMQSAVSCPLFEPRCVLRHRRLALVGFEPRARFLGIDWDGEGGHEISGARSLSCGGTFLGLEACREYLGHCLGVVSVGTNTPHGWHW